MFVCMYACIYALHTYTYIQVLAGDSWASMIARSLFERLGEADAVHVKTRPDVALFFVSYVLLVSMMLLNVVVAVLLGGSASPRPTPRASHSQTHISHSAGYSRRFRCCCM